MDEFNEEMNRIFDEWQHGKLTSAAALGEVLGVWLAFKYSQSPTIVESERRCVECNELLPDGTRADVRRCQYCAVAKHLG